MSEQLTPTEELFQLHIDLTERSRLLMARKNHDYSKIGPFDNFKVCEALQITSAENGIIIRIGDKLSRLASIFEKGVQVNEESIDDTILDIINYAVLLYGVHLDRKQNG